MIHLLHFKVTIEYKSFFASLIRLLRNQHSFFSAVPSSRRHIPRIRLRPHFFVFLSHNTTSFYALAKQNKPYQMNCHYFTVWFFWLLQFTVLIYFSLFALCAWAFVHPFVFHHSHIQIHTRKRTNSVIFFES